MQLPVESWLANMQHASVQLDIWSSHVTECLQRMS